MQDERLGVVVGGSLSRGLQLKVDPEVSLEALRAGMFAIARGGTYDFFSLVTDLELTAVNSEALDGPTPEPGSLLREVLAGDSIYARASLRPHLMVDRAAAKPEEALQPVKTIPGHFAEVRRANREDVERVFGGTDSSSKHFHIGAPLEMEEIPVCLDLARFAERSNGIFGKSGTGKTFLTRMVLSGLIRTGAAVNLVFDMHNEYGVRGTDESRPGGETKGLKQLFGPSKVQVFTLDDRLLKDADRLLRIPYDYLEPEDVLALQKVLGLTPTAAENSYLLHRRFREKWFGAALEMDAKDFAEEEQAHEGAMMALRRKLAYLSRACEPFLRPSVQEDVFGAILDNLERGIHTVIQFGRYDQLVHYLLVANLLTRRIDERWREKTTRGETPQRVVITIEEAHRFLEPGIAEQTTFGRIAREMRKYAVTLLVVDQRPSQIQREVLSQLGTRVCCLLDDEQDVEAVLAGSSGAGGLRSVLAGLDTRQQALLFGHAVPMPVVLKTRTYDEAFWSDMGYQTAEARAAVTEARLKDYFPDD